MCVSLVQHLTIVIALEHAGFADGFVSSSDEDSGHTVCVENSLSSPVSVCMAEVRVSHAGGVCVSAVTPFCGSVWS